MSSESKSKMSSVLGPTAVIIGNVRGNGDLEVRGKLQGSIEVTGRILVAEAGVVLGSIEASQIRISGEVRGGLQASDSISVASSAQIEGDLVAPRVSVEAGARVRGQLRAGGEALAQEASAREETPVQRISPPAPEPRSAPQIQESSFQSTARPEKAKAETALEEKLAPEQKPAPKEPKARKRKRPRPPARPSSKEREGGSDEAPPAISETKGSEDGRHEIPPVAPKTKKPRGPKGPPKVPTFEKGAKGRPRSET